MRYMHTLPTMPLPYTFMPGCHMPFPVACTANHWSLPHLTILEDGPIAHIYLDFIIHSHIPIPAIHTWCLYRFWVLNGFFFSMLMEHTHTATFLCTSTCLPLLIYTIIHIPYYTLPLSIPCGPYLVTDYTHTYFPALLSLYSSVPFYLACYIHDYVLYSSALPPCSYLVLPLSLEHSGCL